MLEHAPSLIHFLCTQLSSGAKFDVIAARINDAGLGRAGIHNLDLFVQFFRDPLIIIIEIGNVLSPSIADSRVAALGLSPIYLMTNACNTRVAETLNHLGGFI